MGWDRGVRKIGWDRVQDGRPAECGADCRDGRRALSRQVARRGSNTTGTSRRTRRDLFCDRDMLI